ATCGRRLRMRDVETAHVVRWICGPTLAADVVVETAIAIGENVEPGKLLVAQITGQRVFILLAKPAVHHCFKKMARAEIFRVPARSRQRTGNCRRQLDVFGGPIHCPPSPTSRGAISAVGFNLASRLERW